jgi:hypothetical protein
MSPAHAVAFTRGCLRQAPQRTFTFNHSTMPDAPPPAPCVPPFRTPLAGLFPPPATLLDGTAEHTKAQADEPEVRSVPVAVRRPAAPGAVDPAAAPVHPERAHRSTSRISYRTARVVAMPVLAPLPHITVHVVQTPRIRLLLANWMRLSSRVLVVPTVIAQLGIAVTETVVRRRSGSAQRWMNRWPGGFDFRHDDRAE